MNKKTGIIISIMIGLAIIVGVVSTVVSSGVFKSTSKTAVTEELDKAFAGLDFVEGFEVTTYASTDALTDPDQKATSAGVTITVNELTGENWKTVAAALPQLDLETMYSLRTPTDSSPYMRAGVLTYTGAQHEHSVNRIAQAIECAATDSDVTADYIFNILQTSNDTEAEAQTSIRTLSATPQQVSELTNCYQEEKLTVSLATSLDANGMNIIGYQMPLGDGTLLEEYSKASNSFASQFMGAEGSALEIVANLKTGEGAISMNQLGENVTPEQLQEWADAQKAFKFTLMEPTVMTDTEEEETKE